MTATLEHDGLIYASDEEYLGTLTPFLREGIANGEGTVVATTPKNRDLLIGALGADADEVVFVPSGEVYRDPHTAIASYARVLDMFARQGRPSVRAVGEVLYGDDPARHGSWLRYEPIAHAVFGDSPLHVVCPYDARALPPALLAHAHRTHPFVRDPTDRHRSEDFEHPTAVLGSLPSSFPMPVGAEADLAIPFTPEGARHARAVIGGFLRRELSPVRGDEALIAVIELAQNGMIHGSGAVTATFWTSPDLVICAVSNVGAFIADPCAGYRPPAAPEHGGMGLWLARQLADEMEVGRTALGPVVRIAFRR